MDINKAQKDAIIFRCEKCDFECSKQSDWNRHITRRKHLKPQDDMIKAPKNAEHTCKKCNRTYKYYSGLWKHAKICQTENEIINNTSNVAHTIINDNEEFKKFIIEVVKNNSELQKQNQELQKTLLEVCKNNNTNINNHSNNKTFNMQFFLNEQCKDAMNIMDFVNTFQFDFSDLERVGEIGYIESMSNVIIQKLNEMDICKRPIHCSDAKRETMFVKDKNVWEKENGNHDRLRLAIRYIGKKNTDMLNKWCEAHPGSCDSDNYLNDIYMEMVMQAMGGRGDREENENKIMRKIARSVLIDKNTF
jgi:hypothetical protein